MSEFINNTAVKQQALKAIIKQLHEGASVDSVKEAFAQIADGITASEIAQMEQALVSEGMPVSEIQRLCDVHASIFKGHITQIHIDKPNPLDQLEENHPINVFKLENRNVEMFLKMAFEPSLQQFKRENTKETRQVLLYRLERLLTLDKHYSRKENLIFPYMERYDITAPPQVMWGVDDEIRAKIKALKKALEEDSFDATLPDQFEEMLGQVKEMIFKEEEIMFPMIFEVFKPEDWGQIAADSDEIGYTFIEKPKPFVYTPCVKAMTEVTASSKGEGLEKNQSLAVSMDAGELLPEEINAILNTLPLDMTFVDNKDRVKYFTQGKERIFDRPKSIIGREVKNCHPPKSVHIVEKIVEDLKSGKKDHEDFWIQMGEKFVYIRYFAVRNKVGEFLGTLEITQDIKPIQALSGEKRLMSEV